MEAKKPEAEMEKMEVDGDQEEAAGSSGIAEKTEDKKTVASSSKTVIFAATVPSVSVSLHPLVLMNISEHWTRIRAQEGGAKEVYGGLIGKQKGRKIEVLNSFELKFEVIDDDIIINKDYYNTKEEQCK
jgi:COP9 signalosome complex subunit 6